MVDVNYGGSTGYGRAYRERLRGQWGVVDVEDTVAAVRGLADEGWPTANRLAIQGGSAGGWTVLSALTRTEVFACGVSYFGVAELVKFVEDTHDFESRYLDGLVGPLPEALRTVRVACAAVQGGRAVLPGAAAAGPGRPGGAARAGGDVPRCPGNQGDSARLPGLPR